MFEPHVTEIPRRNLSGRGLSGRLFEYHAYEDMRSGLGGALKSGLIPSGETMSITIDYYDNNDQKVRPPQFIQGKNPLIPGLNLQIPNPDYIPPTPGSDQPQFISFFGGAKVPNPNYHPDVSLYYAATDTVANGRPLYHKTLTYPKYVITPELKAYYDIAVQNQGNKNEVFRWLAASDVAKREHGDTFESDWIYYYFLPEVINRSDFYFITKEPVEYTGRYSTSSTEAGDTTSPIPRYQIAMGGSALSIANRSIQGNFDSVPYYRASVYLPTYSSGTWKEFLITAAAMVAVVATAGALAPASGAVITAAPVIGTTGVGGAIVGIAPATAAVISAAPAEVAAAAAAAGAGAAGSTVLSESGLSSSIFAAPTAVPATAVPELSTAVVGAAPAVSTAAGATALPELPALAAPAAAAPVATAVPALPTVAAAAAPESLAAAVPELSTAVAGAAPAVTTAAGVTGLPSLSSIVGGATTAAGVAKTATGLVKTAESLFSTSTPTLPTLTQAQAENAAAAQASMIGNITIFAVLGIVGMLLFGGKK